MNSAPRFGSLLGEKREIKSRANMNTPGAPSEMVSQAIALILSFNSILQHVRTALELH